MDEVLDNPAVRAYLMRLIGEEGMALLEKFPPEGEWSDEQLAAQTGINLNSVRHTLYTLYEKRLAEYRRIKNNETGWLTYLWHLRIDQISDVIREDLDAILEKLKVREKFEEENDFYTCKSCGIIVTFNQAFDVSFICPPCDQQLEHYDNEMLLRALKKRIAEIQETLGHA
ncbi:MAG TPA: transcription factor [Methanoregulaceae archaeon]|jgi:transcription initiation factor TFIIE subunit alpha|nr:transcription factor [Methanoregulaceae archaeon]